MLSMRKNEKLDELLSGKRVALVGPAPHLMGKGVGKVIDEYDTVCRMNDIIPMQHLREDYGGRTDILFHNFGTDFMCGLKQKIEEHDGREHWEKLKLVVCPTIKSVGADVDYLSWPDDHVSDVVKNFESVNDCDLPFYWVGVRDYKTLWSIVGQEPNCGMLAILLCHFYDVKELLITGFTFYKANGPQKLDVYCDGHWPSSVPDESDFRSGHGQDRQLSCFKNLCKSNDKIIVDEYMNQLLELNHPKTLDIDFLWKIKK